MRVKRTRTQLMIYGLPGYAGVGGNHEMYLEWDGDAFGLNVDDNLMELDRKHAAILRDYLDNWLRYGKKCALPECGQSFAAKKGRGGEQKYCCPKHRETWHNRTAAERTAKHRLKKKLAAARELLAAHAL
jgi:hypothetical protein